MDVADMLEAIDDGINLWWRTIGKARGFAHHSGDIEWVLSPGRTGPERIFNVRIRPEKAESRADEIAATMLGGVLPGGILLTPLSTPGNIPGLLERRGLHIDDSCPCMAMVPGDFHATVTDGQVRITAVEDGQALRAWSSIVNGGLFGRELFSLEQYGDMYSLSNTRLFLACFGDTPASACMTVQGGDTATLECVATLPEFRRRGLGTAVVAHAIGELKKAGIATVTLRSEPDGVNLYKRLGFKEFCKRIVASV